MTKREEIRELKRQVDALTQRVQALEARPQWSYAFPSVPPIAPYAPWAPLISPTSAPIDLTPAITCEHPGMPYVKPVDMGAIGSSCTGTVIPGLAWN